MSKQHTIPASVIRGKDWRNFNPDDFDSDNLNFFGCAVGKAKGRSMSDTRLGYVAERMNGLEKKYAHYLEELKRKGEILFWRFESHKLRLADKTWYTPDFYIMRHDYSLEIHETKGWMQEDANVKLKTAAELYSEYKFVLVKWRKGQWEFKEYGITK